MDPVALTIGSLEIRWYGIMMAMSMLLGAWIATLILRRHGRDGDLIWDGLFFIIIGSIVGARLVYVVTNIAMFFGPEANPWDIFAVWKGGLSFHGGIIAGLLITYLYFMNKSVPFIEVMDSFAPGVSLGIIMVRFGNFMNGDILGYKWDGPWAMNFPFDQYHNYGEMASAVVPRHPAELYGLLVGVFCLVVSIILTNETWVTKRLPHGSAYLGFVFTYSLVRSIIEEPFRSVPLPERFNIVDPAVSGYGLFTITQLVSIILILLALWGFTQLRKWERLRAEAGERSGKPTPKGPSRQTRRATERKSGKH